ncbi:MAG: peptidyl-prolyl cis-trans isomerase [Cyanobacteriota bacterium]
MVSLLRRLAAEPLAQFLLIGVGLFLLHAAAGSREPVGEIRISQGQLASLAALHERAWMRPPTRRELEGLIDGWIREEVAEREARTIGLDRNDPVIRRRLRQKLEFLSEERADQRQPSPADLQSWLRNHPDRYRRDPAYSFDQVFLDPTSSADPPARRAPALLARLNGVAPPDPAGLADPLLLLEPRFEALPGRELERLFGREFAGALARLKPGAWVGPMPSGYGEHLVKLERVVPGVVPPLAEVRQEVERDWRQDQRQRQREADYRRWLSRYRVVRPALPQASP